MEIELTPEQNSFIEDAVIQGRYQSAAEAVHRAMDLWVERERERLDLVAALEDEERSIDGGEYIELDSDEAIHQMMESVKQRGRAIISASNAA